MVLVTATPEVLKNAAVHESLVDAVDGSSTGT
jgi:hypothetical protein